MYKWSPSDFDFLVCQEAGVFETGFERSPKAHILAMRWRAITVRPSPAMSGLEVRWS